MDATVVHESTVLTSCPPTNGVLVPTRLAVTDGDGEVADATSSIMIDATASSTTTQCGALCIACTSRRGGSIESSEQNRSEARAQPQQSAFTTCR